MSPPPRTIGGLPLWTTHLDNPEAACLAPVWSRPAPFPSRWRTNTGPCCRDTAEGRTNRPRCTGVWRRRPGCWLGTPPSGRGTTACHDLKPERDGSLLHRLKLELWNQLCNREEICPLGTALRNFGSSRPPLYPIGKDVFSDYFGWNMKEWIFTVNFWKGTYYMWSQGVEWYLKCAVFTWMNEY